MRVRVATATRVDLGLENAIVGVLAVGMIATEIATGNAGDCD
jgi:hypothetical protein